MKMHELKCHPDPFQMVALGKKRFEFRKNDRGFKVRDFLWLREYDATKTPGEYVGGELLVRVDYILENDWGVPAGYCIMSITVVE